MWLRITSGTQLKYSILRGFESSALPVKYSVGQSQPGTFLFVFFAASSKNEVTDFMGWPFWRHFCVTLGDNNGAQEFALSVDKAFGTRTRDLAYNPSSVVASIFPFQCQFYTISYMNFRCCSGIHPELMRIIRIPHRHALSYPSAW